MSRAKRLLVEQSKKMGSYREGALDKNAPSRCFDDESDRVYELTELQRAAISLFEPGCPPQMRRMMVEMTPGSGKTNVYFEIIAKFLGRRNPDTGKYFDIVILGDSEVFAALEDTKKSPAKVDFDEIRKFNEEVCKATGNCEFKWSVLYKRSSGRDCYENDKEMRLYKINAPHSSLACKLSSCLVPNASEATCPPRQDNGIYNGKGDALTRDEKYICKDDKGNIVNDECIWRGTRLFLIPYALAGKWIVSSGGGLQTEGDRVFLETLDAANKEDMFVDASHSGFGGKSKQGILRANADAKKSKYQPGGFVINSSNTVFIIDEVQNIGLPSRWERTDSRTDCYAPHLSEALWRQTGDLCNDRKDAKNLPGIPRCEKWGLETTPYLFAGTGTPNLGTNPESSVCLLQVLNGKQRAELFLPRWPENPSEVPKGGYDDLAPRTIGDFRDLLQSSGGKQRTLYWPPIEKRYAKDLIVYPRKFLEKESGFVRDVTKSSEPFSLLVPKLDAATNSTVTAWGTDSTIFRTCREATERLVENKLLPFGPSEPSLPARKKPNKKPAGAPEPPEPASEVSGSSYLAHHFEEGTQHDFAYRAFLCAAREEDLEHQASRIYKPEYNELNREFLQDVVASRVFTANSYYDFRLYPQVLPSGTSDEMKQPLTRMVTPLLLQGKPTLAETPREKAAKKFRTARVIDMQGNVVYQNPWALPADAATRFEEALKKNLTDPASKHADCRWGEWSLCAKLEELKPLCETLIAGYTSNPSRVNVEVEDKLRDFVATYCPKMVQAADDLYCSVPHPGAEEKEFDFMEAYAPGLSSESKSFFFLNARTRPSLDNNLFVILASFYFRMRCRPFLQYYLRSTERDAFVPHVFDDSKVTIQHRIVWLDALLLLFPREEAASRKELYRDLSKEEKDKQGKKIESLFKRISTDGFNGNDTEKPASEKDWSTLWKVFLDIHFNQRITPQLKEIKTEKKSEKTPSGVETKAEDPARENEASKVAESLVGEKEKKAPTGSKTEASKHQPHVASFKKKQLDIKKQAQEAQEQVAGFQELYNATGGIIEASDEVRKLKSLANKSTFFLKYRDLLPKKKKKLLEKRLERSYLPGIFCIGDPNFVDLEDNKGVHVYFANYYEKICKGEPAKVDFDALLKMMGSQGLRLAMNKFIKYEEPCVRAPPVSQSMLFAGLNAHKALDFKCIGLNVSFGPQPRGQRIQELGRNWRNCMGLKYVNLRQIFLMGDPKKVMGSDLLLDSFYEAQTEVINWIRTITISAGLGCSIWWAYSQWTKALSSYHTFRREKTDWFFKSEKPPCLDIGAFEKWARTEVTPLLENHLSFYRCNRTNYQSRPMRIGDDSVNYGNIVRSVVGAFSPDGIVSETRGSDPSCRRGTAVDELLGVKYCLSETSAAKLEAQQRTAEVPKVSPYPSSPWGSKAHAAAGLSKEALSPHQKVIPSALRTSETSSSALAGLSGGSIFPVSNFLGEAKQIASQLRKLRLYMNKSGEGGTPLSLSPLPLFYPAATTHPGDPEVRGFSEKGFSKNLAEINNGLRDIAKVLQGLGA
jgi:hypothetical protein